MKESGRPTNEERASKRQELLRLLRSIPVYPGEISTAHLSVRNKMDSRLVRRMIYGLSETFLIAESLVGVENSGRVETRYCFPSDSAKERALRDVRYIGKGVRI